MNTAVVLFFIHNVLATLLLGGKFVSKGGRVFKHFGIGLLLNAVAFAIWSVAVVMKPDALEQYVTAGAVFFIISLIFFLLAGTEKLGTAQKTVTVYGVIIGAILFYVRTVWYPATPGFSETGFFFFNLHPLMQLLYIFALILIVVPAIEALASKFSHSAYAGLIRYGFMAEVAGAIILITSASSAGYTNALYLAGWIMGIAYLALWVTFLLNKKAWNGVN